MKTAIEIEETLDLNKDAWLQDHCPNYITPVIPITCLVDRIADIATRLVPTKKLISLEQIRLTDWMVVNEKLTLYKKASLVKDDSVEINFYVQGKDRLKPVLKATAQFANDYPSHHPLILPSLNTELCENPYGNILFHGPAFQLMKELRRNHHAASGIIDAAIRQVPLGQLNPALLDACLHCIPHTALHTWYPDIPRNSVTYPAYIPLMRFFSATPSAGDIRSEARPMGFELGFKSYPKIFIQLISGNQLWAELHFVGKVFISHGAFALSEPNNLRQFIKNKTYLPRIGVSTFTEKTTTLSIKNLKELDWIPGTIAYIYEVEGTLEEMAEMIVIKDHYAQLLKVHPSEIKLINKNQAYFQGNLIQQYSIDVVRDHDVYTVHTLDSATDKASH